MSEWGSDGAKTPTGTRERVTTHRPKDSLGKFLPRQFFALGKDFCQAKRLWSGGNSSSLPCMPFPSPDQIGTDEPLEGETESKMQTINFVIPVFNEEKRLEKTFNALKSPRLPSGFILKEIIFVNDGSTDKTLTRLKYFVSCINKNKTSKTKYQILSYTPNKGKGHAVKKGMLVSEADYTLFFDADMSTPLSEIAKFAPFMKQNIDVIVGTRKNGHSTVLKHQPYLREILGKGFTRLTRLILQVPVTDFTCGFKAFSQAATKKVFAESRINGWSYDAEILFLAKKYNFSIKEKAVVWSNDERTKVKLYKDIPLTLWELLKIRFLHNISKKTLLVKTPVLGS